MRLIDADALRERLETTFLLALDDAHGGAERALVVIVKSRVDSTLDAAPSISCAADNPHGLIPSKCPTCGEELVPGPCMDLAMDSYRDGILYGQQHPEWGIDA